MAEKVRFTPKELKKPDKFREAIADAVVFASANYKKILAAFGAVILILIVAFVVIAILERREMSANSEFTEAIKIYADSGQNSEEALNRFLDVKKKYPRSEISKVALYYAAEINYNMGKYDETIELLNDLIKSDPKDQMVTDAAYLRLGTASFNKGNWQGTIDYLSKLDKEGNPYRDQAKLYIAQSLEKLGKSSEAESMYKQLLGGSDNDMKFQIQKKLESMENNSANPTE